MPIYEYECDSCEKRFEAEQKISDPPLKTCPRTEGCKGEVHRLIPSSTSFALKGKGWAKDGY